MIISRTTTKYTAIERKQHCDNWKASGLSINEYAQQTGIATSTIHQWIHRQSIHDNMVEAAPTKPPKVHQFLDNIELIMSNGKQLRFSSSMPVEVILKFVNALESCN